MTREEWRAYFLANPYPAEYGPFLGFADEIPPYWIPTPLNPEP